MIPPVTHEKRGSGVVLIRAECPQPAPAEVLELNHALRIVECGQATNRTYEPPRGLWREVWQLAEQVVPTINPDACVAFAERLGFLLARSRSDYWQESPRKFRVHQTLALWQHELRIFRFGVELHRALSLGKWNRLAVFEIRKRDEEHFVLARPVWDESARQEDLFIAPARPRASKADRAHALLQNYARAALQSETYLQFSLKSGVEGVAASPLGVAWVELLNDCATRSGGECEVCGDWFTYNSQNPRGRRYCSNKCKVAAHRKRQRKVHESSLELIVDIEEE